MANRLAKAKKPFSIGEQLILTSTKDICRELLGEAAVKKIIHVPLSASTVTIAENIEAQLLERINLLLPWYALQVDESTFYRYRQQRNTTCLCSIFLSGRYA